MGAAMGHGQCLWQWPCLRRARGDQGAAVPRMVGFEDPAQMTLSLEARRRCHTAPARARARELNPPSPACKLAKSRALRPYPLGGGATAPTALKPQKKEEGEVPDQFLVLNAVGAVAPRPGRALPGSRAGLRGAAAAALPDRRKGEGGTLAGLRARRWETGVLKKTSA